jgi:hypothetical protein
MSRTGRERRADACREARADLLRAAGLAAERHHGLYGLQLARIRYNPHFFRCCARSKRASGDPEQIRAHQDERVKAIVGHAYRSVPFYRRWYDEHG